MWSSNPLLFQEKLWVFSSLLIVCHCTGGGVYGDIISQPLLHILICIFFLVYLMCRSCSSSF